VFLWFEINVDGYDLVKIIINIILIVLMIVAGNLEKKNNTEKGLFVLKISAIIGIILSLLYLVYFFTNNR
jgi:NADH:ubiquinone oxidoreductase subunit 4 (subunit M)